MAMWYQPRQLSGGPNAGKWHYTAGSDEGGPAYAVGACAKDCPGHDDARGAVLHYVEGMAAGEIRERDDDDEQKKCAVCSAWTQHRAMLWESAFHREIAICPNGHDIREALRRDLFEHYKVDLQP